MGKEKKNDNEEEDEEGGDQVFILVRFCSYISSRCNLKGSRKKGSSTSGPTTKRGGGGYIRTTKEK